jgi:hypothetical protein
MKLGVNVLPFEDILILSVDNMMVFEAQSQTFFLIFVIFNITCDSTFHNKLSMTSRSRVYLMPIRCVSSILAINLRY